MGGSAWRAPHLPSSVEKILEHKLGQGFHVTAQAFS